MKSRSHRFPEASPSALPPATADDPLADNARTHVDLIRKALAVVRPQFRLDAANGIHGVPHWSRVWFHGRRLAQALEVNPHILAWFAFLHDSQRRNDGWDPGHGRRAADYAVRLRRERVVVELSPGEFECLCEAMRLHSDGHVVGEPAILACWDSDRLDLARVGIRPDPDRLGTGPARRRETIEQAVRLARGEPSGVRAGSRRGRDTP
jgi:uncharacterized protein